MQKPKKRGILLIVILLFALFLIGCDNINGQEDINCNGIEDLQKRDKCYFDIAETSKNVDYCYNISSKNPKNNCYLAVAVAIGDLNLCETTLYSDFRDDCYSDMANAKQDSTICEQIDIESIKENCYSAASQTTEECDKIKKDEHTRFLCYV